MPHSTNETLPDAVRRHLPQHAQDTYREAFNAAWNRYWPDESRAHRIAWAAVKRQYRKDSFGQWVCTTSRAEFF
jgi:cation transport regulator